MFENNVISSKSKAYFRNEQDMLFSSILIILTLTLSACLTESHLHQAIRFSEASVVADDGATIAKHSTTAIIHALLVQDQEYISSAGRIHLAMAIVSLEQAIENGNYDEDDSARNAARVAIAHFKEINK
ncbi:small metal-binding protein SmbP [Nitrosomonas ureae]|uniref:Small metal-binding protein n=1 Tax=Nitrosomonas ureae TaxID=44577 RepID=A0A1H5Y0E0_9PROT|nr:small metal-binding protein SmbP [Nitrosomonas ureae]SEG17549.1 Small metal-binding protein [Nitrosomonas ureae]